MKTLEVWCVFDKDEYVKGNFDNAIKKIEEFRNNNTINIFAAWST